MSSEKNFRGVGYTEPADEWRRRHNEEAYALTAAAIAQEVLNQGGDLKELPPDRLSCNPKSPYYDAAMLKRVGVRVNGLKRPQDVEEYCISGGWCDLRVRREGGYLKNPDGSWMLRRVTGNIVAYFDDGQPVANRATYSEAQRDHRAALNAAAVKRARKAAKRAEEAAKRAEEAAKRAEEAARG